jgi:hypothetical protein
MLMLNRPIFRVSKFDCLNKYTMEPHELHLATCLPDVVTQPIRDEAGIKTSKLKSS